MSPRLKAAVESLPKGAKRPAIAATWGVDRIDHGLRDRICATAEASIYPVFAYTAMVLDVHTTRHIGLMTRVALQAYRRSRRWQW